MLIAMKKIHFFKFLLLILLTASQLAFAQGLPPGWEFNSSLSTFIIAVPVSAQPNINGVLLAPGDYIGVFYLDDQGDMTCGGAYVWLANQNIGIIAYGNDPYSPQKDGFANNEFVNYKIYSWSVQREYDAVAICNPNMLSPCDHFVPNGLSGVDSLYANGFFINAQADPAQVCAGNQVQLLVEPSGGSGNHTYLWTSEPPGFTSTLPNPVAFPDVDTEYFVIVTDGSDNLTTSINVETTPAPLADAGSNITICENASAQLNGQQSFGSSHLWTTSGDGTFNYADSLDAIYFPGVQDIAGGSAQLTLTVQPTAPCTLAVSSSLMLTVVSMPVVDAGADVSRCEDQNANISAIILNGVTSLWSTSGDGTFQAPSQPQTIYNPGPADISTGGATLTISVNAIAPCTGTTEDALELTLIPLPVVEAGDNLLICETETALLSGSAQNHSYSQWVTAGDGSFEDATALQTQYFPGVQDISNGSVALSLVCQPVAPCTTALQDDLQLNIQKVPAVAAGDDVVICENTNLQLSGSVSNFDELFWSTTGDGTFDEPGSLNTLYYPGYDDIAAGQATITLTAQPEYPCTLAVSDDLLLSLVYLPTADAGVDATIEKTETHQLDGAAQNYSLSIWSSSGDGFFDNFENLDAVYTPGIADIANAGVVLSLTAFPLTPCAVNDVDEMILTIDTTVGIRDWFDPSGFKIFPNPSDGLFHLSLPDDATSKSSFALEVFDALGQLVLRADGLSVQSSGDNTLLIDLRKQKTGVYFLKVNLRDVHFSRKILIRKNE
ncbi:T9SS type A sorting domain-containing protein [Candidatus Falkowbacteria bacterium]|nr:T9SS type A sorting domain-containing protein [Candidatus Falkowbacteria bacterium]